MTKATEMLILTGKRFIGLMSLGLVVNQAFAETTDLSLFDAATTPAHVNVESAEGSDAKETKDSDDELDELDELDDLLNIADKDVSQLSQVPVARQAAPSAAEFPNSPSLRTEVSTVSRKRSTVGRSPAAVYVISNEMIRRSGARNIPDLLRTAPGVQVARIDANKWAISIRGSNGRFANKLLVQIDGRTIYNPLFAGTFWDVQDILFEDVERIEIVRGPGATVWGANAVNGVINIISKKAKDSQGLYASGGGGTEERGFVNMRYGGKITPDLYYRVYGKYFDRERAFLPAGAAADDWNSTRTGFRTDWTPTERDLVTFQGDYYQGSMGELSIRPTNAPAFRQVVPTRGHTEGGNALLRWSREIDENTGWSVQSFYDQSTRSASYYDVMRETFDLDFQQRFQLGDFQSIVWGGAYRNNHDEIANQPLGLGFQPSERADDLFSYFVQDEITLLDDVWLTLGSKFSHNDYTGFEYQPNVRLLWAPDERHSIWGSVSRAIRSPSRAADDLRLLSAAAPGVPFGVTAAFLGNRDVLSEELLAFELGVRGQPDDWISWDLATFYHDYENLIGVTQGIPFLDPTIPGVVLPFVFSQTDDAQAYGAEFSVSLLMTDDWRVHANYSFLRLDFSPNPSNEGASPRNQIYIQSSWDLTDTLEFDAGWRYVDQLPTQQVAAYNALDLRLAWLPSNNFEVAVVARNLLDQQHFEFGSDPFLGTIATEIEREMYVMVTIRH